MHPLKIFNGNKAWTKTTKYLGITSDSKLTYRRQILKERKIYLQVTTILTAAHWVQFVGSPRFSTYTWTTRAKFQIMSPNNVSLSRQEL
jgi:hypothetical protein